jgi:predicted Rossmann-fold nucleotide-binding protein
MKPIGSLLVLICLGLVTHPILVRADERTQPSSLVETANGSKLETTNDEADLVVFGGTPAGIMAAVAAGRSGSKVILIEPSYLIGGLMSGGLHKTDIGNRDTIGGLSKEFFRRVLTTPRHAERNRLK